METMNDVLDYSRFYFGKDEPPPFHYEHFELKNKIFIPVDDFSLAEKLGLDAKKDVIIHHFAKDTKQNRILRNNLCDRELHKKVFAVSSPDFSADGNNCFSCFNEGNILKSRICAYRWQSEEDERVLLTWLWAEENTYKWAFSNVDKGTPGLVSAQSIKNPIIFEKGFRVGIDMIQPDFLCWYGNIPDFVKEVYDLNRIIKIQTRTDLLKLLKENTKEQSPDLFENII